MEPIPALRVDPSAHRVAAQRGLEGKELPIRPSELRVAEVQAIGFDAASGGRVLEIKTADPEKSIRIKLSRLQCGIVRELLEEVALIDTFKSVRQLTQALGTSGNTVSVEMVRLKEKLAAAGALCILERVSKPKTVAYRLVQADSPELVERLLEGEVLSPEKITNFEVNLNGIVIINNRVAFPLTQTEAKILSLFLEVGVGRVISRSEVANVLGIPDPWQITRMHNNYINLCIVRIRRRLAAAGVNPAIVETVREVGHRLHLPQLEKEEPRFSEPYETEETPSHKTQDQCLEIRRVKRGAAFLGLKLKTIKKEINIARIDTEVEMDVKEANLLLELLNAGVSGVGQMRLAELDRESLWKDQEMRPAEEIVAAIEGLLHRTELDRLGYEVHFDEGKQTYAVYQAHKVEEFDY